MARVLIVERAGRARAVAERLAEHDFALREVAGDRLLPGDVVGALEGVTVVCWLMGAGKDLDPEINGEQLETVLLKVVDTGVRGFVFERPDGQSNAHVEHARATWHIPIAEVEADPAGGEQWASAVATAVGSTLGVAC
ncbi:MAG: hypothetical protein WAP35_04235 [Solirubrobacterales bacterium]